jgi:alkylation response protein AidB-like acyl-CoA dehydrogenase
LLGIATTEAGAAVRNGLVGMLEANHDLARLRLLRKTPYGFDLVVWRRLADEGWLRADVPEHVGGMGLAAADAAVIPHAIGEALAPEPYVALGLLPARLLVGVDGEGASALLQAILSGERLVALAWAERAGQAGDVDGATRVERVGGQSLVSGTKRFVAAGAAAETFLVTCRDTRGASTLAIVAAHQATVTPLRQIDGAVAAHVVFEAAIASEVVLLDNSFVERALDDARLAVAVQLLGMARKALQITLDYARLRRQFGQPIAGFQALQHRLVNMASDLRRAEVCCDWAVGLRDGANPTDFAAAAAAAKASAARASQFVAQGAIQVHGAIGYTDEADIGLYLAAVLRLAPWLGGADAMTKRYADLCENMVDA